MEDISLEQVETLVAAIDARDHYTSGHSMRVAAISALIAHELGWSDEEVEQVRHEGMLHDIGKIGVPDAVLKKPGKLTEDEYEVVKRHTTIGHAILSLSGSLGDAARVARSHHERWDGKGYPDGLRGSEIPPHARVVAVADAYDAMLSDRVYRKGLSVEAVREEFVLGRGQQFESCSVDALLRLLDRGALELIDSMR